MHIIAKQETTASGKKRKGAFEWTAYNKGEITAHGRGFRDTTDAVRGAKQCVTAFISPFRKRVKLGPGRDAQFTPITFVVTEQADGSRKITWS